MSRLVALLLLFLSLPLSAQQVEVRGARVWTGPDETRVVVDTEKLVSHRIFPLDDPHRLVIDIPDARLTGKLPAVDASEPLLAGMRSGIRDGNDLRLVLDLKQEVRAKSFLLEPNDRYGHRLVVDIQSKTGGAHSKPKIRKSQTSPRPPNRDVVVAIDAGHGGEDSGAIGAQGTKEKDITLQVARKLADLVKKNPGMRPALIRDGDYTVGLRKRMALARKHQADLFVSIHADAFRDRRVGGSSVYTLSHSGASSEAAKWLAERENAADLIGGVDLAQNDGMLATVLLDMTQNATLEHSNLAADQVLANLRKVGAVHKTSVQKAGFVVLKSPDIPSMLVETGFITNPQEEKRLRSGAHQSRLARAILAGIESYFVSYPPPGTRFAKRLGSDERRYVIHHGDTLSEIAQKYNVSLASLRSANRLDGDHIRVGQVLRIPGG